MQQDIYAMALNTERQRLSAKAEQGWRAAQARAGAAKRMPSSDGPSRVRVGVAMLLLRVGMRLQGAPGAGSGFGSAAAARG